MAPKPAWAIAAPANPPINVCEEEEGMPNHQVNKFQHIAAIKPDKYYQQCDKFTFYSFGNRIGNTMIFKNKKSDKIE